MDEKIKKVVKVSILLVAILLVLSVGVSFFSDSSNLNSFEGSGNLQGNVQLNILPSNSAQNSGETLG